MMSRENVPGPGAYIGVESQLGGPKFTMHGKDGGEHIEKRNLQRSRSEGAPATAQRDIRRFISCTDPVINTAVLPHTTQAFPLSGHISSLQGAHEASTCKLHQ